eukprot:835129-Lingulodinium_polyedra.AAC.1
MAQWCSSRHCAGWAPADSSGWALSARPGSGSRAVAQAEVPKDLWRVPPSLTRVRQTASWAARCCSASWFGSAA